MLLRDGVAADCECRIARFRPNRVYNFDICWLSVCDPVVGHFEFNLGRNIDAGNPCRHDASCAVIPAHS